MTVHTKTYLLTAPLAALVLLATGCPEPEMRCRSAQGAYGVRYGGGDLSCIGRAGDRIGLRTYNPGESSPDFDDIVVGLQVGSLGAAIDRALLQASVDEAFTFDAEDGDVRTTGQFEDFLPDDNGMCHIPSMGTTSLSLPAIPEIPDSDPDDEEDDSVAAQPAIDVTYEWNSMDVLATPAAQGLQFIAEFEFTDNISGCSESYTAVGLYPAVACTADDECVPAAGISVDFPVYCDTDAGYCTIEGDPPSLK